MSNEFAFHELDAGQAVEANQAALRRIVADRVPLEAYLADRQLSHAQGRLPQINTCPRPAAWAGLDVCVPLPAPKRFYGHGIPGADPRTLTGRLIVVEARMGQVVPPRPRGSSVARRPGSPHGGVGLKRSTLVSEELERAQQGTS
jgi:hypothetical protein